LNQVSRLPVTFALISACLLVYAGVMLQSAAYGIPWNASLVEQPLEVLRGGALMPELVARGEAWRLLTSVFLHAGFTHLALNMVSLYFLGSLTESLFERGRFLFIYLLSGISGGIAYLYFGDFDGLAVGASGAIFGLLGSIFGYTLSSGSFSLRNPVLVQLLFLLVLNLSVGFSVPNISNTAHLGGLAGGFVLAWLMAPSLRSRKRAAAAPVLLVLGAEALLLALWYLFIGAARVAT
jgi:rhomboid protease GluP